MMGPSIRDRRWAVSAPPHLLSDGGIMAITVSNRGTAEADPHRSTIDRQLAVLLRQTQWLLDDAAHDIPAGRYQQTKRDELAVVLEQVAALIRGRPPGNRPALP